MWLCFLSIATYSNWNFNWWFQLVIFWYSSFCIFIMNNQGEENLWNTCVKFEINKTYWIESTWTFFIKKKWKSNKNILFHAEKFINRKQKKKVNSFSLRFIIWKCSFHFVLIYQNSKIAWMEICVRIICHLSQCWLMFFLNKRNGNRTERMRFFLSFFSLSVFFLPFLLSIHLCI